MSYYPKSQIKTDLFTNGKEFIRSDNGQLYVGSYWKTSNGEVFSGKTPEDRPYVKLLPIPKPVEQTPLNTTTEWKVDYPSNIVNKKPGQVPKQHLFTPTWDGSYTPFIYVNNYFVFVLCLAIIFAAPVRKVIAQKFNSEKFEALQLISTYGFHFLLLLFSIMELAQSSYNPFIYYRF